MIQAALPPVVTTDPATSGMVGVGPHRALFLDRDGVINVNHGYVHTIDQTEWVSGIFDLARAARSAGFVLVVVTNQAGIARGYYTEEQFSEFTRWMHAQFEREGAPLLATYYCPHHPEAGIGKYNTACVCRKPGAGMLNRAASEFKLDASRSVIVGDSLSDMRAGDAAGVGKRFWLRDGVSQAAPPSPYGALTVASLDEVTHALLHASNPAV